MNNAIGRSLMLAGSVVLLAVAVMSPAHAATSVVHDPSGDAGSSPSYLDVIHAYVIEQRGTGTFLFEMQLAGAIPEAPGEADLIWPFHVNTAATVPGPPFLYNEYVVRVRWLNGGFVGQVVDRTPLLSGGSTSATFIPFSIDGRTVKMVVPHGLLGNPSSFGWNAATRPGAANPYTDFAPDAASGADDSNLATWTR